MFTARYGLNSYITQKRFVFKGLIYIVIVIYIYIYIYIYVCVCVYVYVYKRCC